jgi:hypothetical protein
MPTNTRGYLPRQCRPYRAKTKGKVERFIGYLRHSFQVPLVAKLKQAGLTLDVETANLEVLKWLHDMANARTHQTIQAAPAQCWQEERQQLQALPPSATIIPWVAPVSDRPSPTCSEPEDLQHALSVYEAMLQEGVR